MAGSKSAVLGTQQERERGMRTCYWLHTSERRAEHSLYLLILLFLISRLRVNCTKAGGMRLRQMTRMSVHEAKRYADMNARDAGVIVLCAR